MLFRRRHARADLCRRLHLADDIDQAVDNPFELAGIVALNVITLSLAASTGRIYQSIEALEQDNSITLGRDAVRYGTTRIRREAAGQGLFMPSANQVRYLQASSEDAEIAARRLALAGAG